MKIRIFQLSAFLFLGVAAGLGQYLFFVPYKTPVVSPEQFHETAYPLRDEGSWRYGFVQRRHGATLVRTSVTDEPLTFDEPLFTLEDLRFPDLPALMTERLDAIPQKAAKELAFYLVVIAFAVFLFPRLLTRIVRATPRPARIPVAGFISATAGITASLVPIVALGWGRGAFTNLCGPYPLSYSGVYFWFPRIPGGTVSYRMVLEMVYYYPGRALDFLPRSFGFPEMPFPLFLFLLGILFYGVVIAGAIIAIREAYRVFGVPSLTDPPESTLVPAVTRQLLVFAIAAIAANGALVVLGTKADWQGLPLWFYVSALCLVLPVGVCGTAYARLIGRQKSRLAALRARTLLIDLAVVAGSLALLLNDKFRNSYLGDLAHIFLLCALLAGLALCVFWFMDREEQNET